MRWQPKMLLRQFDSIGRRLGKCICLCKLELLDGRLHGSFCRVVLVWLIQLNTKHAAAKAHVHTVVHRSQRSLPCYRGVRLETFS